MARPLTVGEDDVLQLLVRADVVLAGLSEGQPVAKHRLENEHQGRADYQHGFQRHQSEPHRPEQRVGAIHDQRRESQRDVA